MAARCPDPIPETKDHRFLGLDHGSDQLIGATPEVQQHSQDDRAAKQQWRLVADAPGPSASQALHYSGSSIRIIRQRVTHDQNRLPIRTVRSTASYRNLAIRFHRPRKTDPVNDWCEVRIVDELAVPAPPESHTI